MRPKMRPQGVTRTGNMNATPLRILLVDDHAVTRAGYRAFIERTDDLELVAETGSGERAVRLALEHQPDAVVMDLNLPDIGGIEAIRRLVQRKADARVLAFSQHEEVVYVAQALQAGARGYVSKTSPPATLLEAVREVGRGEIFLEPGMAERLTHYGTQSANPELARLSTREFEIFSLLATGATVSAIARQLALSPKTVANYTTQIKLRLKVNSLAELTRLAIRHGVVRA